MAWPSPCGLLIRIPSVHTQPLGVNGMDQFGWFAIEKKLFLAAWLVTGNLTMEEAYRCLVLMEGNPEASTPAREALWAACSGLAEENSRARQPCEWRRTLHDIIPTRPAEFCTATLLVRRAMLDGCDLQPFLTENTRPSIPCRK
jgi:hypothetical protein